MLLMLNVASLRGMGSGRTLDGRFYCDPKALVRAADLAVRESDFSPLIVSGPTTCFAVATRRTFR
jgi:hypothetical protein